jgi:transcriptional regulator with XRE-family HTH domain
VDDRTLGQAIRALRQYRGWRQLDLALAARLSQSTVSRAELGQLGSLRWDHIRGLFAALDAGCSITPWWRSGAIDRLLDEDHALLVALAAAYLRRHGWTVEAEVSFAVYGERGSIDLLASRRADGAVLIVEVKSRLLSVEELLRTLDKKVRLAGRIVRDRLGWSPSVVGRLVVMGDDSTNRDRVRRAAVLEVALPLRAVALREWLEAPRGSAAGIVFLRPTRGAGIARRTRGRQRIYRSRSRTNRVARSSSEGRLSTEHPPGG